MGESPVTPLPPSQPPSHRRAKWLIGCAAGCLVVVVLLVALFGAGTYYVATLQVAREAPQRVRAMYDEAKQQRRVPADLRALFDHMVDLGTSDRASLYAAGLTAAVLGTVLADGQISPDEESTVRNAVAILEANPDVTKAQFRRFFRDHPDCDASRSFVGTPGGKTWPHSSHHDMWILSTDSTAR